MILLCIRGPEIELSIPMPLGCGGATHTHCITCVEEHRKGSKSERIFIIHNLWHTVSARQDFGSTIRLFGSLFQLNELFTELSIATINKNSSSRILLIFH